jgi:hypothetical protein
MQTVQRLQSMIDEIRSELDPIVRELAELETLAIYS